METKNKLEKELLGSLMMFAAAMTEKGWTSVNG